MIAEFLFGFSLVSNFPASLAAMPVVFEPRTEIAMAPLPDVSIRQKETTLLPLVTRATECIVRHVSSDPRYEDDVHQGAINDLIADSIPACAQPVRAMMDAHDMLYGSGSGEAFLLGPYMDVLPSAIVKQAKIRK